MHRVTCCFFTAATSNVTRFYTLVIFSLHFFCIPLVCQCKVVEVFSILQDALLHIVYHQQNWGFCNCYSTKKKNKPFQRIRVCVIGWFEKASYGLERDYFSKTFCIHGVYATGIDSLSEWMPLLLKQRETWTWPAITPIERLKSKNIDIHLKNDYSVQKLLKFQECG